MGGEDPALSVNTFQRLARALTDEALVALANRGLVKRAQKDLAAQPPEIGPIEDGHLSVRTGGAHVHLSTNPAESRCSCKAQNVCRHILTSWMALRDIETSAEDVPPSPCNELDAFLKCDDDELLRWAGKALMRQSLQELSHGLRVTLMSESPLVVQLDGLGYEVRGIGDGRLTALLCSCHATEPCLHRVAALLALQMDHGTRARDVASVARAASPGAPRSRAEFLQAVERLLADCLSMGFTRLSNVHPTRANGLASAAHGVDLPRLERGLQALATELAQYLGRSAAVDRDGLLKRLAELAALTRALQQDPKPELVGWHRGRFHRATELHLNGVGASVFRTGSGYRGLTCHFQDGEGRFLTWTDMRPMHVEPFDPAARYRSPGPWTGCVSPHQAATSSLRLMNAWRTHEGRLSGRESTRAFAQGPSRIAELTMVRHRAELGAVVRRAFAPGLQRADEHASLVIVEPERFSKIGYSSIDQTLRGALHRDGEVLLRFGLPYEPESEAALRFLMASDETTWQAMCGRLRIQRGRLELQPISLIVNGAIVSPGFESVPAGGASLDEEPPIETKENDVDARKQEHDPVEGRLIDAFDQLASTAERGSSVRRPLVDERLVARLREVGMTTCADALRRAADTLGERRGYATLLAAYAVDVALEEWRLTEILGSPGV